MSSRRAGEGEWREGGRKGECQRRRVWRVRANGATVIPSLTQAAVSDSHAPAAAADRAESQPRVDKSGAEGAAPKGPRFLERNKRFSGMERWIQIDNDILSLLSSLLA